MFTLLHTNDFHNHLTAIQAEILRRLRLEVGAQGLLVDAGDAVASGNVTFRPWGETILRTMSHIGYDALTVGNREFHVSRMGFHCKVGLARFPVLCANVRSSGRSGKGPLPPTDDAVSDKGVQDRDACISPTSDGAEREEHTSTSGPQADPPVCSHIVRTLQSENGIALKVVLFGLTVPMVTERMAARHASAYLFDNPIAVAKQWVPQWQAAYRPDLIIALTHIGNTQDRKLADAVPEIDLIVGGHSHTRLPNGERVGKTLIVQTGCFGHHVGRVDISPDSASGHFEYHASLMDLPKTAGETEIETQIIRFRETLKSASFHKTEMTV